MYKINPDLVAKLYKGGKITERTAKLHGYAEGGMVEPVPMPQVAPQPAAPQEEPGFLSRVGQGLQEMVGLAPDSTLARTKALAEKNAMVKTVMPQEAAVAQPSQAMMLASAPAEGQAELETFQRPNVAPQPQMMGLESFTSDAAIRNAMAAGREEGVRTAAAFDSMAQYAKDAQTQEEQALETQKADFDAKQKEINDLAAKYASINPTRQEAQQKIWKDMSTGQKILAGIGLVFGSVAPDGINRAAKLMMDAVDKDVDNQFKQQTMLGNAISEKRGLLNDMMRIYGDQRTARLAAKKLGLDQMQLEVEKYQAKTKNQTQLANLALLRDQLAVESQKTGQKLFDTARKVQGADPILQQIYTKVPEEQRKDAIKELGELNQINQAIKRSAATLDELAKLQSVSSRIGSPIASQSLLARGEAMLFPIVKRIVGERMTDADARILIQPYLIKFTDSKEVVEQKKKGLRDALEAQAAGVTPILSGFGIRREPIEIGKRAR